MDVNAILESHYDIVRDALTRVEKKLKDDEPIIYDFECASLSADYNICKFWADSHKLTFNPLGKLESPEFWDELWGHVNARKEYAQKAYEERMQKVEAKFREKLPLWISGQRVNLPHYNEVHFRVSADNNIETTQGAKIPYDDARLFYQELMSGTVELPCSLGSFKVDSFDGETLKAGCHIVNIKQIKEFATSQGW